MVISYFLFTGMLTFPFRADRTLWATGKAVEDDGSSLPVQFTTCASMVNWASFAEDTVFAETGFHEEILEHVWSKYCGLGIISPISLF